MPNPLLGINTTTLAQVPQGDDITYFRRRCPTNHFVQNLVTSHVEVRKGIPYRVFNHRECLLYSRETKALDSKDATFVKPLFGNAQVFRTDRCFIWYCLSVEWLLLIMAPILIRILIYSTRFLR